MKNNFEGKKGESSLSDIDPVAEDAHNEEHHDFYPPREVRKVRKLSRNERKEQLPLLKERLQAYIASHAKLQEAISAEICANPDGAIEDLYAIADAAVERGEISSEDRDDIDHIVDGYDLKHRAVWQTRMEHPRDNELYSHLFGVLPFGRVEVVTGPMTLYFRCYDERDYARIRLQKFSAGAEVSKEDIREANKSGGVHLWAAPFEELNGTITAENSSQYRDQERLSFFTRTHEEQHAINQLLSDEIRSREPKEIFNPAIFNECGKEERKLLLRRYLRWWREVAEMMARDEILAYYKEDQNSLYDISQFLIKPTHEGGIYDYMHKEKRIELAQALMEHLGEKHKDLIRQCVSDVLVDDYHKLFKKSIDAVEVLSNSYTREQTIAILQRTPLNKWHKITMRLAKQEWEELREEYAREQEKNNANDHDDYEKMPKHSGFGRSKHSGVF